MSAVLLARVAAALAAAMATVAPPARLAALPAFPGWEESAEERAERYDGIASAAAAVAFDPAEAPVFGGPHGRARTAGLLLGVAWLESGFARDVGPCHRRGPRDPRCDFGRSACLMQIQIGEGATAEGWTREDLFGDRERCFRAGLALIRKSFRACAALGEGHGLDAYAVGACGSLVAAAKSRPRLAAGRRVFDLAFGQGAPSDGAVLAPDDSAGPRPVGLIPFHRWPRARRRLSERPMTDVLQPLPAGATPNHIVTPEVTEWAQRELRELAFGQVSAPTTIGGRVLVAREEMHGNGTAQNPAPHPHPGISTYVLPGGAPSPAPAALRAGESRVLGVDVSHYQHGADLAQAARAGYAFASIKVSEGLTGTTAIDASGPEHFARAGDAGMQRGAYHFFRPATSDPIGQVRHFFDVAGKIGRWELPPTLDVEWLRPNDPKTPIDESLGGLSPEAFSERLMLAGHELVSLGGRVPLIYTAPGFWRLLRGHADELVTLARLWLAHYTAGGAAPPPLAPWPGWDFWQFSASAHVPGIPGNADVDQFAGTLEELYAYAGVGGSTGDLVAGARILDLAKRIDAGEEGLPQSSRT